MEKHRKRKISAWSQLRLPISIISLSSSKWCAEARILESHKPFLCAKPEALNDSLLTEVQFSSIVLVNIMYRLRITNTSDTANI